jgi:hypothetical protein
MQKMKKVVKISVIGIGIIVCAIVFYIGYRWLTYIDDAITSGDGYGFSIGDSKEQTFEKANNLYQNKKVFILYPVDHQGFGPHREFKFTKDEYVLIKDCDFWKFYYSTGYFDLVTLTFEQNKLVRIYRHRKKFELP